jgi:hypothetical protein
MLEFSRAQLKCVVEKLITTSYREHTDTPSILVNSSHCRCKTNPDVASLSPNSRTARKQNEPTRDIERMRDRRDDTNRTRFTTLQSAAAVPCKSIGELASACRREIIFNFLTKSMLAYSESGTRIVVGGANGSVSVLLTNGTLLFKSRVDSTGTHSCLGRFQT